MNLRIAIVEDESYFSNSLKEKVLAFANQNKISAEVHVFETGDQFFFAWSHSAFDIVFLDIYLKEEDGTQIAQRLRQKNDHAAIIFVTTAADRMSEGFDYQAEQYLVKPIDEHKLYACMDRICKTVRREERSAFLIKSRDFSMRIPYGEILYFSKDLHRTFAHTQEGAYYRFLSFKELLQEIPQEYKENFVQCFRSYIVNVAYIHSLDGSKINMVNKDVLPLGDRYLLSVRAAYENYYRR